MQVRTESVEAEAAAAMVQVENLQATQRELKARNELLESFTLVNQQVLLHSLIWSCVFNINVLCNTLPAPFPCNSHLHAAVLDVLRQ